MGGFTRPFVLYETCCKGIGLTYRKLVEEHRGRLNGEASSRLDLIDVMLTMLKGASLFRYSRETIIKATVVV